VSPSFADPGPATLGTRVIAVANQKGGVGKTTTVVNLGAELADRFRVLLVDLDPQANATSSLGIDPRRPGGSTYDALLGETSLAEVIVSSGLLGLDVAPASRALAGAQVELVELPERERCLARALAALRPPTSDAEGSTGASGPGAGVPRETPPAAYDLILIDTPPSLGILTLNALAAADGVVVPVQCEYLALEGLGQLTETLDLVRGGLNPRLALLGILLTMHDPRTNLSGQVAEEVRRHFPSATFGSMIPRSVRLSEAPSHGRPIRVYDPSSRGAQAYAACARELADRLGAGELGVGGRRWG
jgi:chromosome partitioning protein